MCVLLMKVAIQKKSGNLFNDPRALNNRFLINSEYYSPSVSPLSLSLSLSWIMIFQFFIHSFSLSYTDTFNNRSLINSEYYSPSVSLSYPLCLSVSVSLSLSLIMIFYSFIH